MADNPFDREIWNTRERPMSGDSNLEASYADQALREVVDRITTLRTSSTDPTMQTNPTPSFAQDGFQVTPRVGMQVRVVDGFGVFGNNVDIVSDIDGITGLNDLQRLKPLVLANTEIFVVPANASGLTRVDIIEVRYRREATDSTVRGIMPVTLPFVFTPTAVDKTLTWSLDGQTGAVVSPAPSTAYLSYKQGVPGAGAPATTANYTKLCEITVVSGAVVINAADIKDFRRLLSFSGLHTVSFTISIVPGTGVVTLLDFAAPAGVPIPTFLSSAEVNGRMLWTWQLGNSGVPHGSYVANRCNVISTMDVGNNNFFPIVTNRLVAATLGAPLSGQVQSIVIEMGAALGFAAPPRVVHANPTTYRTTIHLW